jgi:Protein of unknown function (DUF2924)
MPNSSIASQLSFLSHLHKPALSELWQQLFKTDPPLRMRKELMLQFVAYRMQEQEFGALSDSSLRRLRELANAIEANSNVHVSQTIKPGTRFIRQWKDQVYIVNVEEGEDGQRQKFVAQIAKQNVELSGWGQS